MTEFYFPGIGTVATMLLIVVGGAVGLALGKHFPERQRDIVVQASGLVVLFIGISGMLAAVFRVEGQQLTTQFMLPVIISMILGGMIGEGLDIEGHMDRLGNWLERRMGARSGGSSRIAESFCASSILFCTGAMSVVGSLNDGLLGDPTILYSKAIIDCMLAAIFAVTLGPGVIFSAITVGVYQGSITALSVAAAPLLTATVIAQMSAVGSLILLAVALKMLEIKKFRPGNLLPGMFIPLIWYGVTAAFG